MNNFIKKHEQLLKEVHDLEEQAMRYISENYHRVQNWTKFRGLIATQYEVRVRFRPEYNEDRFAKFNQRMINSIDDYPQLETVESVYYDKENGYLSAILNGQEFQYINYGIIELADYIEKQLK